MTLTDTSPFYAVYRCQIEHKAIKLSVVDIKFLSVPDKLYFRQRCERQVLTHHYCGCVAVS